MALRRYFFQSFLIIYVLARLAIRSKPLMTILTFAKLIDRKFLITLGTNLKLINDRMFCMMMRRVLIKRSDFKVFNSVVKFIVISMMHNFKRKRFEFSPKIFFHNVPMLKHSFAIYINQFITMISNMSRVFRCIFNCIWRTISSPTKPMFDTVTSSIMLIITIVYNAFFHKTIITNQKLYVKGVMH